MTYLGGGERRKDPGLENNGQKKLNVLSHDCSAFFALKNSLYPMITTGDDDDGGRMELSVSDRISRLKPPSSPSLPPATGQQLSFMCKISTFLFVYLSARLGRACTWHRSSGLHRSTACTFVFNYIFASFVPNSKIHFKR